MRRIEQFRMIAVLLLLLPLVTVDAKCLAKEHVYTECKKDLSPVEDVFCGPPKSNCSTDFDCLEPAAKCCLDGCNAVCVEFENLVQHFCRSWDNYIYQPGEDYWMPCKKMCSCGEDGYPTNCVASPCSTSEILKEHFIRYKRRLHSRKKLPKDKVLREKRCVG
ncbi:uncharacterized protein LOC135500730 isoform X2 [Lineus longissimus]|uniref:uncharacterized protein LOC135500730 isoform X2 n=1 Tax=Lineus longissimus TaxID=88925 RepID=UPI002B4C36F7